MMITKRFEVNGKKASLLGYGAMRLPTVDGGYANPWAPNMSDKAIDQKLVNRQVRRMLPPGAGDRRGFALRCASCQLCVANCPGKCLRPSVRLASFGQPVMDFRCGYCLIGCTKCSRVCPARPQPAIAVRGYEVQRTTTPMAETDLVREKKSRIGAGSPYGVFEK